MKTHPDYNTEIKRAPLHLLAESTTSIEPIQNGSLHVRFTPHPIRDYITIELNNEASAQMLLNNSAGVLVKSTNLHNSQKIDLTNLPAGINTIVIRQKDNVYHSGIIKL